MRETDRQLLDRWSDDLWNFAGTERAVALGVFDMDGSVRYLNAGMRRLLGDTHAPQRYFVVPTFDTLRDQPAAEGMIYQGWLTFGSDRIPHRSVHGRVLRRDDLLLVMAAPDVEELERVNYQLMKVNQEMAALQRELARNRAELATLNDRQNEFIGIAAHDLRSPLSAIQGFVQLLLRYPHMPDEEQAELLNTIKDSVQDMLGMLHNLLSVSQIEAGKLNLQPREVELTEYAARVLRLHRHHADQKQITLALDVALDQPAATFDPDRVQQVLDNLVSNAIKFSHPHTTTTLRITQPTPDTVEFAVIDQGQGIPEDELDKVFLAFERTSVRPTGGEHSTGLGLAICKRIVELSGGTIGVESAVGEGSRFYFTLPANVL